jgi:hypothetical protein
MGVRAFYPIFVHGFLSFSIPVWGCSKLERFELGMHLFGALIGHSSGHMPYKNEILGEFVVGTICA